MSEYAEPWSSEEKETFGAPYSCEILFTNVTDKSLDNSSLPSDSYLVYYRDKEGNKKDICRASKMVNIFDLYYDRFGSNIKFIDYTKGRMNPKIWGQNKQKAQEISKKK